MNNWTNQTSTPNFSNNNNYFNPYQQPQPQNTWQQPHYTAAPIQGLPAANNFPMAPNSEIFLPDADKDIIWWIKTDNMGNRNVTPFDITPHKDPEPVDMNDIIMRLAALEEKINAKSNKSNAKRNNSAVADSGGHLLDAAT